MKPWPDALRGGRIRLRNGSRAGSAAVPRVPPWLPCSHTSRTSRITPTPPDDSAPWTSWCVPRSRDTDPRVRPSARNRAPGHEAGLRAVRCRKLARRTSYRRWTTARARGDPPRAEAAEDAREGYSSRASETLAGAAPAPAPTADRRRRRQTRTRARIGNPGWILSPRVGDSTVVAAWTKTRGRVGETSRRRRGPGSVRLGRGFRRRRRRRRRAERRSRGASRGSVGARRREVRSRVRQPGSARAVHDAKTRVRIPLPGSTRRVSQVVIQSRRAPSSRGASIQVSHTGASSRARIAHRSTALERSTRSRRRRTVFCSGRVPR